MRYNIISLIFIITINNCLCMEIPLYPSTLDRELAAALLTLDEYTQDTNTPKASAALTSECRSTFTSKDDFQSHAGRVHRFQCDKCLFAFTAKIQLRTHKYEEHGELMNKATFSCDLCKKLYKTARALAGHIRTHDGDLTP